MQFQSQGGRRSSAAAITRGRGNPIPLSGQGLRDFQADISEDNAQFN
jgi:hypothetical protein